MKVVHVAVGVVRRGTQVFISLRADNAHQGGKWEFP
ncbi:MAG: 8-oxo-dGTP diphosphatase MutT, partial [Rickettsiales bacterium]|nr:8-oxo-dGTP diphosphatase MutT [Rickettsiales bacterium]